MRGRAPRALCQQRTGLRLPVSPRSECRLRLNEKLLGAHLSGLPEIVLVFESNGGADAPVGGANDVPPEGVHDGGINVLYADGHAKWLHAEAAMDLLARPVE